MFLALNCSNLQVVIRIRPLSGSEVSLQGQKRCVRQDSSQSLTWIGHPESRFTFDLVADEHVTQVLLLLSIFSLAFVPLSLCRLIFVLIVQTG